MTTPNAGPGRGLREDRIHRYVTAFCPSCHEHTDDLADVRRLSGWLTIQDGSVWLERGCPDHGLIRTLYEEDAEILRYLERWQAPTKSHVPDDPSNFRPTPENFAYGLPPMHTQHTCILLEDITEQCNLQCPTCFTASGPTLRGVASIQDILANVDQRLEREDGRLDVLMLSGGEPTLYPAFAELLAELARRPIIRIMVNTNGLRIARDDEFLALLAHYRQRVEVYLQYDGPNPAASVTLRGADLTEVKDRAIKRLSQAGIFTTLVMTAALDVNDGDVGHVILRALNTPFIGGVSIQPVFGSGRGTGIDPNRRLTNTGVLKRLKEQTGGIVSWPDLTALPCSHPHCASVGYMLRDDADTWHSLTELVTHDGLLEWLELEPDVIANRMADQEIPAALKKLMKSSFLDLLSEQSSLSHPRTSQMWKNVCTKCDLGIGSLATLAAGKLPGQQDKLRRLLGERVKRITVKPFQDINTMIEERLTQCCVHVGTVSTQGAHQCAPFCAVQAWPALGRQRISSAKGRVLPMAGGLL